MQQPARPILPTFCPRETRPRSDCRRFSIPAFIAAVGLTALSGCGDTVATRAEKGGVYAGVSMKLRCHNDAFRGAISQAAQSWATRTGASLTLIAGPMTAADDSDIGIIPAAELGYWADRDELAAVPAALRAADHPFQWNGVLPAYRERLIEWGGQARGIPLGAEGLVIVYRADRLADANLVAAMAKRGGGKPGAPSTWEEFADLAAAFTEVDGKPSLTAMSDAEVADLFFRVAACYDRPPLSDASITRLGARLSFQFDATTGEPRLDAVGFTTAANWLASLAAARCFATAPDADLASSQAMLGVLTLAQVSRLRSADGEISSRYGIAPLPGTRTYTDPVSGKLVRGQVANYVPYFSAATIGVVRGRCTNATAAFDLLAELGGPVRSQELISDPTLGIGPFRTTHFEQERLIIWLGYGFDAERSKQLQAALQQNARVEVRNATYGLREPDQKELDAAAALVLGRIAKGAVSAEEGIQQLQAAWVEMGRKTPADTRQRWRKLAAGAN